MAACVSLCSTCVECCPKFVRPAKLPCCFRLEVRRLRLSNGGSLPRWSSDGSRSPSSDPFEAPCIRDEVASEIFSYFGLKLENPLFFNIANVYLLKIRYCNDLYISTNFYVLFIFIQIFSVGVSFRNLWLCNLRFWLGRRDTMWLASDSFFQTGPQFGRSLDREHRISGSHLETYISNGDFF